MTKTSWQTPMKKRGGKSQEPRYLLTLFQIMDCCSCVLMILNLFQTRKKTPSKKDSAADDEKPHYPPERDANQNTLFHEPSNWMQVSTQMDFSIQRAKIYRYVLKYVAHYLQVVNGYRGQGRLGFSAPSYHATAVEAGVGRSAVVNQVRRGSF